MYASCTKCGAKSVVCWSKVPKETETPEAESGDKEEDDHDQEDAASRCFDISRLSKLRGQMFLAPFLED